MKNNSTLSRKPRNDMVKNSGLYPPRSPVRQGRDVESMAFNGQMGTGVNRDSSRDGLCVNPNAHMVKNPDQINAGYKQSARRGNSSDCHTDRMSSVGPSVTRDPEKMTIATASQGSVTGKRDWMPKSGQNYRGNPDKINVGMK
jgi:hypothetical protein